MNKLLQRQINKYLGNKESLPEEFLKFLSVVDESYDHYEKDRVMLERSIELSSKEMIELNNNLRKETEVNNRSVYESLKESLSYLQEEELLPFSTPDANKIMNLAELLKNETRKRKNVEKQNRQHRTHLEASQRIAKVGSWELRIDVSAEGFRQNLKAIYLSEETYNILDFESGTDITIPLFFSRVHPDDTEFVNAAFAAALSNHSLYDIEHRIVTLGNHVKVVHTRAEIIYDERENRLLVKGTIQDISDTKVRDEQLQRANFELRTLFDNMQEVFYSVDMESYRLVQMSPACEKMYGRTVDEFISNPNLWLEVIIDEDKPIIFNNTPLMERGETIIHQYRIRHKNGDIRWIESRIQPTLNEERKLVRIDGLNADITKRKEAELALIESESKFRFLIENSTDAIMVVNDRSEVSYASDSLYRIMGYTPEEVIGVPSFNFIYAEDMQLLKVHLAKVLDKPGETLSIMYRRIRKDGSYIWCEGSATNLLHEKAIQGIVINFKDITERKAYEDALKASNEELKKSNSELDRFVYSVSHDLRAPLSSMLGVVEMSESDTNDAQMLKHFGMLKKSINRLDGFINDILDYSRNARGQVKYETIDFKELVGEVTQNLKFMDAGHKEIAIRVNVADGMKLVSDKSRISIILNNLVSNAIRYSNPDQSDPFVAITVDVQGSIAEILIEDNGLGISSDKQEKVFEMFYRVSNKSAGSGLGLYIVKETVEKLRGSVELKSELSVGSKFRILLPELSNS